MFESGSYKVQNLERYIFEDVDRYGTRLGELDKKLVSAYCETVRDYTFLFAYGPLIHITDFRRITGRRRVIRRGYRCTYNVRFSFQFVELSLTLYYQW